MPVAVETLGTWDADSLRFIQDLGRRLTLVTGDRRETSPARQCGCLSGQPPWPCRWLHQRCAWLSSVVQNCVCVLLYTICFPVLLTVCLHISDVLVLYEPFQCWLLHDDITVGQALLWLLHIFYFTMFLPASVRWHCFVVVSASLLKIKRK